MISAKEAALKKIAQTPKGAARAELLKIEAFRAQVLNSGANVTIYTGELHRGNTFKEMLSDVYIGLIKRKNKHGMPDGIGALGGMAERTNPQKFAQMTIEQKRTLVGQKDDVILVGGMPYLTDETDVIRRNNVAREMREELADLGISGEQIDLQKLKLVPMPKVKDDNYIINIWDGKGECYAITPYCHLYADSSGLIDRLAEQARERADGEARGYVKVSLFDALGAYGNRGTKECMLEDGRHAEKDYRYPHEYLAAWALAAKYLDYNPEKMIMLAKEVQAENAHPISFVRLAQVTGQLPSDIAQSFGVSMETLKNMEQAAVKQYILSDYLRSIKSPVKS
ncbi:MAG: hypothetical protein IJ770_02920 [Alphaproteobacteria bacterium]|nr:hypothetical protein [Alphaproteobacteria bacterium]